MPCRIFISYRRDDSIGTAGRLYDRMVQTFGRDSVFMDVDHIPAGVDFVRHLNSQVAACNVFLAVIGPNWLEVADASGRRRLDNPEDFVRLELQAALARDVRVIPVLIDGARMPKPDDLPEALRPLSYRQAVELRNVQFGSDVERLIGKIGEASGRARLAIPGGWPAAIAVAVALLAVGSVALYRSDPEWLPWKQPVAKNDYRILVINRRQIPITKFFYSDCGDKDFGRNRLGPNGPIVHDQLFDMHDQNRDCCRDMMAVFGDNVQRRRMKVDVCKEAKWEVD